jgi:hypothetical protein
LYGSESSGCPESIISGTQHDSIDKQVLYNGRVWRVLYKNVKGFEFLFTKEFMQGSVTIDGRTYNNLALKYDIYNDEILTTTDHGIILQLNKAMIEKFTLLFENKIYNFQNIKADSVNNVSGYVNVLHNGKTMFFIKNKKDILLLADDNKYDIFSETSKTFLMKDGAIHPLNNKKDLVTLLADKQLEIKTFIKKNRIQVSKKIPESFVPVLKYYDTLQP